MYFHSTNSRKKVIFFFSLNYYIFAVLRLKAIHNIICDYPMK
jgi:hypothetical protein